jgi:hypothetical protein
MIKKSSGPFFIPKTLKELTSFMKEPTNNQQFVEGYLIGV